MKVICGDIETDGLLSELTKLHCAGFDSGSGVSVFTNMQDVKSYLDLNKDVPVVMHNGICFDKEALTKLGYTMPNMVIDTLAISWYLYPTRAKHGLDSWGEELGIMKPVVTDWSEQPIEVYIDRVTEDTKIQKALWSKFYKELYDIYGSDKEILRLLKYLNFKMKCLMVQERNGVRVDEEKLQKLLKDMLALQEEKKSELQSVLPQVPKYVEKTIPKVLRKMNGELSSHGVKWFELLKEHNLPESHTGPVKVLKEHVPPNANSHSQIKDWLYSFGWKPETYKYVRNKETNENRKIPQITDNDGDVCPSISKLANKIPEVRCLEGLGVLQHRISVLNGFIRDMQDGKLRARSMGFTNTLRMRHTELANIPSGRKPYGADIRSLITTDSGYVYIGADLSSLEDRLKHHYQWDYDPEYVKTQMEDGYDPHLLMCVLAGLLTEEQAQAHKDKLADYSDIRHQGKGTNYSCLPIDNTEVLTRSGWKHFDDLNVGEDVLTYNTNTNVTEWKPCVMKHHTGIRDLSIMSTQSWSLESTDDHRWFCKVRRQTGSGKLAKRFISNEFQTTEQLKSAHSIITSAPYIGGTSKVTPQQAALIAWVLSDGSLNVSRFTGRTSQAGGNRVGVKCSISQSKFNSDVEYALGCVEYSVHTNSKGLHIYTIKQPSMRKLLLEVGLPLCNKSDIDYTNWILGLSQDALKAFYKAFWLADGYTKGRGIKHTTDVFYQNSGNIADAITLVSELLGYNTYVSGKNLCKVIRARKYSYLGMQNTVKSYSRKADTFCITTDNSTFVVRQGGFITITGNCQYGAGAETVARAAGVDKKTGLKLHKAYNDLNWSVKAIADSTTVKTVNGTMWQYNPISKLWYYLKVKKDRFSTLVQGSAAFVFDMWLVFVFDECNKRWGIDAPLVAQFHDELLLVVKDNEKSIDTMSEIVNTAVTRVNKMLLLNRDMDCDVKYGKTYYDVH